MNELGLDPNVALEWFQHEFDEPYTFVRVSASCSGEWESVLSDAVRRCYLSDDQLRSRTRELVAELQGTFEALQNEVIMAKLPDPSATMAGDFGEILIYVYQSAKALPRIAFGPKKWRLKHDRTKPAPGSDVVHFILPAWPNASDVDEILCAEVKMKSTDGTSKPIQDAIIDCEKDRTSRLSRTLQWLKERALTENLGEVKIAHLNRFINATDHPVARKRFRAVAVICEDLVQQELVDAPQQSPADYELVVVAVPNLHAVYNAVFKAAASSTLK